VLFDWLAAGTPDGMSMSSSLRMLHTSNKACLKSLSRNQQPWRSQPKVGAWLGCSSRHCAGKMPSSPCSCDEADDVLFQGKFRSVHGRRVLLPSGQTKRYEIVKGEPACIVVPYNTVTHGLSGFTLIREFHVSAGRMMYGTVAGIFEPEKHKSPQECAQFELEEEAQLTGGTWLPLIAASDVAEGNGVGEVGLSKYFEQRFWPFLVLDAEGPVTSPRPLDHDEYIEIMRGVSPDHLFHLIESGNVAIVHAYALLLAVERLRKLGLIENSAASGRKRHQQRHDKGGWGAVLKIWGTAIPPPPLQCEPGAR